MIRCIMETVCKVILISATLVSATMSAFAAMASLAAASLNARMCEHLKEVVSDNGSKVAAAAESESDLHV